MAILTGVGVRMYFSLCVYGCGCMGAHMPTYNCVFIYVYLHVHTYLSLGQVPGRIPLCGDQPR